LRGKDPATAFLNADLFLQDREHQLIQHTQFTVLTGSMNDILKE
jgi:hypothetical protein